MTAKEIREEVRKHSGQMTNDYIKREDAIERCDAVRAAVSYITEHRFAAVAYSCRKEIEAIPAADVVKIPETGIGDLSDGYHTFNGLYEQRMILFAALVKAYKDKAWKSYRHEDGEYCFGGGWFVVGIDTPEGSYTYHYENNYWDMFDCIDLPRGKHWDGHTEEDVTRLLSLNVRPVVRGKWIDMGDFEQCSHCTGTHLKEIQTVYGKAIWIKSDFCPNCGADMREES